VTHWKKKQKLTAVNLKARSPLINKANGSPPSMMEY